MKTHQTAKLSLGALLLAAGLASGQAQSGTWSNDASGLWSNSANWLNGGIANGTDATADFSTLDITADRTVTLDSSRTVGSLLFGDTNGTQNWFLNSSGGSTLTLAVSTGTPTIAVSNNTATLNVPVGGTAGLTKAGNGTLVLASPGSYSGATTVSGGTLQVTNAAATSTGPLLAFSFDHVSGNTVLNDGTGGALMNGTLVGAGASIVPGGVNGGNALSIGNIAINAGYVLVNNQVTPFNGNTTGTAWTVSMWIKTTNAGAAYMYQGDGGWAANNTSFFLTVSNSTGGKVGGVRWGNGWMTGNRDVNDGNWHYIAITDDSGAKTIYVDGQYDTNYVATQNWSSVAAGSQVWIGGTGGVTGDGNKPFNGLIDEVSIYNRALSQPEVAALMTSTITPSTTVSVLPAGTALSVASATKLDLNGNNQTLAGLSGAGLVDTTLSNAAPVLTLNNNTNLSFSGSLTNSAGILSLIKSGTGALTLSGANGYTGNTLLNGGTLNINNASALGSGTVGRLVIGDGTVLDNTSGSAVTLSVNKAQTWLGDFTFTGSADLNLAGTATLSGAGSTRQVTVNAGTLTARSMNSGVVGMGLTKAGAGTLALGAASSTISGTLNMAAGKLQIGANDFAAGGLTGSGIIEDGSGTTRWFYINTTNNQTFSGTLQNGSGSGRLGFNLTGGGTITLTGSNYYGDTTTIQMGRVVVTGTNSFAPAGNGVYNIGTVANQNGVLEITGGTVYANKNNSPSVQVGAGQNYRGFIKFNSGLFNTASELHIGNGNGNTANPAYAAMSMESGTTMTNASYLVVGFNNDRSVFNQRGGNVTVSANVMTIGAGGTAAYGVANLSGGTFTALGGNGGIYVGERGLGVLNVSGNASVSLANNGLTVGPTASQTGWTGIANLLGGTVTCNRAVKGNGTGTAFLNFNGGTLAASTANGSFINNLDRVTVFSGGATIDDGGFAVTANSQLTAPSGNGLISIPVLSGGSNYLDAPLVMITNLDGGLGAMAIAQIDYTSGTVTSIQVVNPGNDYYMAPAVGLYGGGGSGAVLGTPVIGPCASGGLTKKGTGTLSLAGGYTYTGPTVVNAGTLAVNPSMMYSPVGAITVNGGAGLSVDASSGTALPCASLTLQNNAILTLNYGTIFANPYSAAITVAGNFSAPGNVVVNIAGFGLQVGTVSLIHYGTASLNVNNFLLGPLPPGVQATLVNNTANSSLDLQITKAGQNLVWSGNGSSNWDVSLTPDWVLFGLYTPASYQEYTTTTTVGDPVRFDDSLYNDYVNPPSTNIWLTTNMVPFMVTVDSTLPYSFTGPGSLGGQGFLVKSNIGSLTIGTLNSYSGGSFIYGGSLIVSNDAGLGAAAGPVTLGGGTLDYEGTATNTRVFTLVADSGIAVGAGSIAQLGGPINGRSRLNFDGLGTKILTGTGSGMLHVRGGTLILQGNERFTNTVNWTSIAPYYDGALPSTSAQMILRNNAWLEMGTVDFNVSDSTVGGPGDYGRLDIQDSAVLRASRMWIGKGLNATGVVYQTGGIWTNATAGTDIRIGGNGTDQTATFGGYYLSGGRMDIQQNFQIGTYGYGEMNVTGGSYNGWGGYPSIGRYSNSVGVLTVSAGQFNQFNTGTYMVVGENGTGTLNVSGTGLVTLTNAMRLGGGAGAGNGTVNLNGGRLIAPGIINPAQGMATFNFNGGVLQANASSTAFMQGLTAANVLAGGAVIDSSNYSVTMSQALRGSGGLTKNGTGTLTLLGADSYTGSTLVNAGRLVISPLHYCFGPVTVADGAALGLLVNGVGSGAATVGSLTIGAGGANYLDIILNTGSNPTLPVLQVGNVTINGTCAIRLNGLLALGTFPVLNYGSLTGTVLPTVSGPQGMVATVSNNTANSTLYVTITQLASGVVWRGNSSVAGSTNLWDLNTTINWLVGATPTYYQEFFPPGDAVTFNDVGSGTVVLSNTVNPAGFSFSNSNVNYSLTGPGHVSGFTGLTKQGAGRATLGLSGNDYTGNTVVNGGILQLGSATAIPMGSSAGKLIINSGGTVDLNGFSPTMGLFSGLGRIDNSSGSLSTITVGNGNTSLTWDGTIDSSGSGGALLTKVGNGTLVLTGTNYFRNAGQNQINGGTLLLTNNAYVNSSGEFWFQQNAGVATGIVDHATLIVNSWLVVARNNAGAYGTLIVNSGLVQKTGGNNIVVGSLGAQGTLIVNGGRVLNNGNLWLGENATANGTLYLNGGLIQATQVRPNNAVASSIAYFNGGTLQASASSSDFIQSSGFIQSGGLVLDDNGYTIQINTALQADPTALTPGGLVKQGAGKVYLDGANSYSGTTLVSTGMLAGIGSISGPVVVAPTGILGAGDTNMGVLTISGDLTLQGQASFRVSKTGGVLASDQISVAGRVTYGGTLVVTNITSDGTPLAVGDTFTLFPGLQSGSFATIVGSPGSGLAYQFANGVLSIVASPAPTIMTVTPSTGRTSGGTVVTITGANFQSGATVQFGATPAASVTYSSATLLTAVTPPSAPATVDVTVKNPDNQTATAPAAFTFVPPPVTTLSSAVKSGGNLVLTWSGAANSTCVLLSSTNVALPRTSWSAVATNVVLSDGRSTNTIPINPGEPKRFYLLSAPYN